MTAALVKKAGRQDQKHQPHRLIEPKAEHGPALGKGCLKPYTLIRDDTPRNSAQEFSRPANSARIASPICEVETASPVSPLMSAVRRPLSRTLEIAFSILSAASMRPRGIAQSHAEGGDHGDRVGDAFAGDVGRRTMHRLIERLALAGLGIDLAQ